ncbi:hypothetical protein ABPG72_019438 [Tetrahymena utriculariae]
MEIATEVRDVYTFSPGPCSLPLGVQRSCHNSLWNFEDLGYGSLEIPGNSYESKILVKKCKENLRTLFELPENYSVLLMEGGAHLLNSGIPLNMIPEGGSANYLVTGFWGARTHKESLKYGNIKLVHEIVPQMNYIPDEKDWQIDTKGSYFHFTDNETLSGLEFKQVPYAQGQNIVADMTSSLGTKKLETNKYAVIYAAAQKNLGIAGNTVAFVRNDFIGKPQKMTPSYMDWRNMVDENFDYNMGIYSIYATNTYVDYLNQAPGKLEYWENLANQKAKLIWDVIDGSRGFFKPLCTKRDQRSRLNITFYCANDEKIDNLFIEEAAKIGLIELKGHAATKGVRASIYNGTQLEGVKKLRDFMLEFQEKNEVRIVNTLSRL